MERGPPAPPPRAQPNGWKQSMIRTDFDVSLGSGGKSGAIVGDAVAMPCAIIGDVATPCAIIDA
eukprot:CAMPEP_0182587994 /NCGR_PEP_ID=MMETSP1324-20130603/66213_1 /TAXON_ID=236786 /ORGANISM="Florenciella sp., Strain RCC1587" /LENGTH=63 /DNA_ID=CAMNT_0024805031 /DNA_START=271 /DNA_END=462 /DNA_ORIENTATION=-